VGFDDFAAERKTDAGARLFRRIERQQRVPHHLLGHPAPVVEHLDP
jgi:hypothetical protein